MEKTEPIQFKILIVDDNPKNIRLVGNLLTQEGYPTAFALNGRQAIDMIHADRFDLILLDVMMPEMSGFEVCEYLKNQEETKDIPVIFLTAKTDSDSIVKGFDVGAYDYVVKPFISRELLARVRTQLNIKSLNDELKERYENIKQLEMMRETLMHMIVHDLKNPLSGITGYAQLLRMNKLILQDPKALRHITAISSSTQTMLDMIMAILDLAKLESEQLQVTIEQINLQDIVNEVIDGLNSLLVVASIEFECQIENILYIHTDREIIRRIIVNLMGNAIHFSPEHGKITLCATLENKYARIAITDQGHGIPHEFRNTIFDKFKQVNSKGSKQKYSTGLGLAFCKTAIEHLGGSIGVDSEINKGSTFWILLPLQ
ncbi:MAG: hybrid sensor histidine kinase/response regulator [Desulfobacterales bacterium]|nr:hybrid sensor histidine kinase/response regulator [Desulfobacterales bacterium]